MKSVRLLPLTRGKLTTGVIDPVRYDQVISSIESSIKRMDDLDDQEFAMQMLRDLKRLRFNQENFDRYSGLICKYFRVTIQVP